MVSQAIFNGPMQVRFLPDPFAKPLRGGVMEVDDGTGI
jgi:hypothetical protein